MGEKDREQLEEVAQRLGLRLGDASQLLFDSDALKASPLPYMAKIRADEESSGLGYYSGRYMADLMGGEWRGHDVIAGRFGTQSSGAAGDQVTVTDACAVVPVPADLPAFSVSRGGRLRRLTGGSSDLGLGDLDGKLSVDGDADLAREILDREIAERLVGDWEDVTLEVGGQFTLAHRSVHARRPTRDLARYAESLLDAAVTLRERIPHGTIDRHRTGAPEEPW